MCDDEVICICHDLGGALGGGLSAVEMLNMLFTVCSAITVYCCVLYPCCAGVFGGFAVM